MALVERIKTIIKFYGLSTRAFAIEMGMLQQTLDRQLRNDSVRVETLLFIMRRFSDVSAEWLMRGKGPMLNSEIDKGTETKFNNYLQIIAELSETINKKSARIEELSDKLNNKSK